jgi:carotenoid cleavage dioxygenase-like enzyme
MDVEFRNEHPFLAGNYNTKTTRFEFNLKTGEAKQEAFIPTKSTEFPIVNQDELGYKTKYMYLCLDFETVGDSQGARDNVIHSGFIKIDTDTKQIVGEIKFGDKKTGGEIFF